MDLTIGIKMSFAAEIGTVDDSSRKVVEYVGQGYGIKMSRMGITVAQRLTADTVSPRCRVSNMLNPSEVGE